MSTRLKEKQEKILQILKVLVEESKEGTPIIVEGKKDAKALRGFGVEGAVLTAKTGGKSFLDVVSEVEKIGADEVVLFLDFDRRGREGTKCLKMHFERAKIKTNLGFWRALSSLIGKELQCVEGLSGYLETLNVKIAA